MTSRNALFSAVLLAVIVGSGCSGASNGVSISTTFRAASYASDFVAPLKMTRFPDLSRSLISYATSAGSASESELDSMKYFIQDISICTDLTPSGNAYSIPSDASCFSIYQGPSDSILSSGTSPGFAALSAYALAHPTLSGWVDLMQAQTTTSLQVGTTSNVQAGSYSWGYITWAYPILVKASSPTAGGTLYTHPGVTSSTGTTTSSTSFTSGPEELAAVVLPNGGTWFKFQNPFVVSDDDVSLGTEYALDLAFNPNSLVRGFKNTGSGGGTPTGLTFYDGSNDGTNNGMSIPFIDLTPVPRLTTGVSVVETYLSTSLSGTSDMFTIRLELYYQSEDSEKTIYGATLKVIPDSNTQWATDIQKISLIEEGTVSGTLDFKDWQENLVITGFKRQTSIGDVTTVTIPCAGANSSTVFSPVGCAARGSITATFVLSNIKYLL